MAKRPQLQSWVDKMDQVADARTRALQVESTRIVMKTHRETTQDIKEERRKATFPVEELMYYMTGGKEKYEKK